MKKIRMGKLWKVSLALLVSLTSVGAIINSTDLLASEDFDVNETISLNEEKTQATITLDIENINEKYSIQSVEDPDGVIMDITTNPSYTVDKNGTYTFLISYQDATSDEAEVVVYEKEVSVTQFETKNEEMQKTRAVTNSNGDNLAVEFMRDSGSNIDWSDVTQLDWNYYDEEKIEITAVFSEKGISKTREIYVDIPDGYEIIGYSAKTGTAVQNGEVVLTTTDEVQQVMISSDLTSQNGGVFGSEQLSGYKTTNNTAFTEAKKSGKIKYVFNSEADMVVLTLRLGIDTKLSTFEDTKVLYSDALGTTSVGTSNGQLLDNLKVEMVSGSETLQETVKANVKETVTTLTGGNSSITTTYIGDDNYSTVFSILSANLQIYNYTVYKVNMVFDEVVMTYTYPEGAIFTGMSSLTSPFIEATDATYVHDELNRTITVTYKNFQTAAGTGLIYQPTFKLDGDIYGLTGGKQTSASFKTTTAFKFIGSDYYIVDKNRNQTMTIVNANQSLKLTGYDQKSYDYYANDYEGYQYLGSHSVENPSFVANENANLEWTFTEGLGVRIIRFGMPKDSTISDVVIYTTKHPTGISVANMKATAANTGAGAIIDADVLGLEKDDYITKVTGVIDTLPANTTRGTEWATKQMGYAVYGSILNGSGGTSTLTVDGVTSTATTEVTTERVINPTDVKAGTLQTAYYPGDEIPVSLTYNIGSGSYNRSKKVTDDFLENPTIYIRVPEGFSLNESSLNFEYLGNINDLVKLTSKTTASDGATIYKYEFDEEYTTLIGRIWKGNTGNYSTVSPLKVSFGLIVSPSNQGAANLLLQDFVMLEGQGNFLGYDGSDRYIRNDDYGLTSSGNNLLVPDTSITISVIKLPELQILSGIRVKDSGNDFYIYNGSDSSIAGLSRTKNAEVEISYYNNAPSVFEKASIYFPIPKAGEDYGVYFNNKAISDPLNNPDSTPFTWSANLTGEVTVSGFTTLYATDGTINTSANDGSLSWEAFEPATGWKTYSEVSSNLDAVVFLKFVSNDEILSGETGSFTFELQAASDSPVDEVNYWRTYSSAQPSGTSKQSWVVGSVLAGSLSVGEISGLVFYDNNANGKYDEGDTLYTGSDLTINLSEKDGKISTTTLAIESDGTYSIERLKEGEYSISVINTNNGNYHFSKTTTSTNTIIGSNVSANASHSEGRYTGMVIKAGDIETYENVGIGLISKVNTSYEFEDRVMNDVTLSGKSKLTISASQIEYDGTLINNTFPQETFSVTPNVILPDGMVHLGWQLYSMDSSNTKTKLGDMILPADFKDTAVPTVDSDSSLLVKAVVSYGPTLTTPDLIKYVGDSVDLLDGIVATTESGTPIALVAGVGSLGNTEVTQSIPISANNYTTAGTYEVTYKVKDLTTGSYTTVTRLVKVHEAPTVSATPQDYTLGDVNIMNDVLANPSATWKEAQATANAVPTEQTISGPADAIGGVNKIKAEINGPSTDFSVAGIYTVTYTATDANGKTGSKTVNVLIKSDTYKPDSTDTLGIDADYFVLENTDAKNLTETTAKADENSNVTAVTKTFDESNVQIGYANIERADIRVNDTQLEAIKAVGDKGGIFNLTYSVTKDGKTAEITVKVFVKPVNYEESDDESLVISATGFAINYEDASLFDDTEANVLGIPVAYKITKNAQGRITNIETLTPINVNATHVNDIQSAPINGGTYNLEYFVNDGSEVASITVKVFVRAKGSIYDKDLSISAYSFILENSEASSLTQADANTKGKSVAYRTEYIDNIVSDYVNISDKITVDDKELNAIKTAGTAGGIFDLTYTINDNQTTKSKTVKVLVKPLDSMSDSSDSVVIYAKGFALEYEEAGSLTTADANNRAYTTAYGITYDEDGIIVDIQDITSKITIDATQLSRIQEASTAGGIFDLTFTVTNGTNSVSIEVPVLVNPKYKKETSNIILGAEGFSLKNKEASSLDQATAILSEYGNASAYKYVYDATGNLIGYSDITSNITVDEKELKAINNAPAEGGIYNLTFYVTDTVIIDGEEVEVTVEKTVKVTVEGMTTPPVVELPDGDNLAISAKDFTVENAEAAGVDKSTAIALSEAEAWLLKKDTQVDLSVDEKMLEEIQNASAEGGIYDLTFSATYTPLTRVEEAYTIETTIKVTVLPLGEEKPSTTSTTPTASNPSVAGNGTNTGDTTNLNLYIGLAVISLLVIVGRKFRKETK